MGDIVAGSIKILTDLDPSGLKKNLSSLDKIISTGFKAYSAALAGVSTAIIKVGKDSNAEFATFEQMKGGVEKLFGDSADALMAYANAAYATAGMSANAYMDTVTNFSASLITSLGGDTKKAVEYANAALKDMSDNANTFGTDMASVQNAYQGFAKQNFTMLDNLKLGYGGTKEEMQRLLADAEKISGIKYDISSFADITQAIHVMQEEMGIAGTTAKEAAKTIEGSANMMKAAWQNVLMAFSNSDADLGDYISKFAQSFYTYLDNLLPAVDTFISRFDRNLFSGVSQALTKIIGQISPYIPVVFELGASVLNAIIQGFVGAIPTLAPAVIQSAMAIITGFMEAIPLVVSGLGSFLMAVFESLIPILPQAFSVLYNAVNDVLLSIGEQLANGDKLIEIIVTVINSIINLFTIYTPLFLETAVTFLSSLINAIPVVINALVAALPRIINTLTTFLAKSIPAFLDASVQLLLQIVNAIPTIINTLVTALPDIINCIITFWTENYPAIITSVTNALENALPTIIEASIQMLLGIIMAIPQIVTLLFKATPQIISALVAGLMQGLSAMLNVGVNLVKGIWSGISSSLGWIKDRITSWVGNVTSFVKRLFKINSPSKLWEDQIGKNLALGIGVGFDDEIGEVQKDMAQSLKGLTNMESEIDIGYNKKIALDAMTNVRLSEMNASKPIVVQSVLDGNVISETVANYNQKFSLRYGV